MAKIICSANVPDDEERKALMEWVRSLPYSSFSELDEIVSLTYTEHPEDLDNNSRKWGIIHTFEQYPIHSIQKSK